MRLRVIDVDGSLTGELGLARQAREQAGGFVDARDLAGELRLIASRRALGELARRLDRADSAAGRPELTFFGSGDFHHLTYVLLARLDGPVSVAHFDNHPDWVRWPGTVNCGSWVARALERPDIAKIVTIGPCSDDLANPEWKAADLQAVRDGRLEIYPWAASPTRLWGPAVDSPCARTAEGKLHYTALAGRPWGETIADIAGRLPDCPVFVTLDKDVLHAGEATTNWDQGALTLDRIIEAVTIVAAKRRIVGMDVCGDYSPPVFKDAWRWLISVTDRAAQPAPTAEALARNGAANARLVDALGEVLS